MLSSSQLSLAFTRTTSAGKTTAVFVLSFLTIASPIIASISPAAYQDARVGQDVLSPPGIVISLNPESPQTTDHIFTLRHIYHHGIDRHPRLHRRYDVTHDSPRVFLAAEDSHAEHELPHLQARSHAKAIERLVDRRPSVVDPIVAHARQEGYAAVLDLSAWTMDEIPSPDITDKGTILSLAYMAADAYVETDERPDWEEVGEPFNRSADFGWQGDGLRGHIWADDNNSTVVIGLKGTSPAVFDGDGTTTNDKINDNLFFSCCCAQQGQWTWHQVCDCATGTYSCNNTCVSKALREENRYYGAARELYSNVTERYPNSTIWIVGHSLGGAISSLLGLTYGLPVVTFEAVPEALAATRLGLPIPPGADPDAPQRRENTGAYHFGHTADPIYIGTCNGATASCSFAGYALETACHTGSECVYDVVADKGWRVGIGTHKIRAVISDVILKYDDVPECSLTPECRDCAQWKMYKSNGTDTTTTSTSSTTTRTRTRTTTCQTPGWWGCLDKTTTMVSATTTTMTSLSTSTCKTPGWFGCKDKTTTTVQVTTTSDLVTSSTPATTTCETPGKFWGCWDDEASATTSLPSTIARPSITSGPTTTQPEVTPTSTAPAKGKCQHRSWIGLCKEWEHYESDDFISDEM
ncbi:putative lipase atg15 [Conoideocrella luteorostrata]|uniref:triacylglycerol lipase n=1 Tax=Conoideocrella luteorostrata TaxID=1105319 RepID=A0AAJ0CK46_9HYPO|nr:putative lipase atg15 [Conoideocrella luteorostrata]